MLHAELYKICGNMAIMAITKQYPGTSCSLGSSSWFEAIPEPVQAMNIACPALRAVADAPVTGNFVCHNVCIDTFTLEVETGWYGRSVGTDAFHD